MWVAQSNDADDEDYYIRSLPSGELPPLKVSPGLSILAISRLHNFF